MSAASDSTNAPMPQDGLTKLAALRALGDEWRADWSDFDGRCARRELHELADEIQAEHDERVGLLASDLQSARWTIDKIRERIHAAVRGDLTALFDELDRLCLSDQQMRRSDPSGQRNATGGEDV